MEMWRKNLWVLVVAVILCGSSYTMLVPFLPIFLLDLGVTGEHVKMWSGQFPGGGGACALLGAAGRPVRQKENDHAGRL